MLVGMLISSYAGRDRFQISIQIYDMKKPIQLVFVYKLHS